MFYAWKVFQLRLRPEVKGRPKKESAPTSTNHTQHATQTHLDTHENAGDKLQHPPLTARTFNCYTRPPQTVRMRHHAHAHVHHMHDIPTQDRKTNFKYTPTQTPDTPDTHPCTGRPHRHIAPKQPTTSPRHNNATTPPSTSTAGNDEQRRTHEEDDYDTLTKAIKSNRTDQPSSAREKQNIIRHNLLPSRSGYPPHTYPRSTS